MDTLNSQEIAEVIADTRVAHIGVIADGEPYVTPISFVPLADGIAFRSLTGKRLDAIAANGRVSIEMTVHDEDTGAWRSVVASGSATVVEDPHEEATVIQGLLARYRESFENLFGDSAPGIGKAYIIRVVFGTVSGRSSGSYLQPRTRPGRL